jgi:hypothetical protein
MGATNVSLFAYVAGGKRGLQVVQLISPEETKGHYGFSPRPTPRLIASHHFKGEALAISEGVDRDRAVDENGNQLAVFGRRGARPLNLAETLRMYTISGQLFRVPEIKDGNTKINSDIRRFYGAPVPQSATDERQKKNRKDAARSEGTDAKEDATDKKQNSQSRNQDGQQLNDGAANSQSASQQASQTFWKPAKSHRLADIVVFMSLFGAVVIRFSRLRKPFKR